MNFPLFIILTDTNSKATKIDVNVNHIISFNLHSEKHTRIYFVDTNYCIYVKETPEEIRALISEAIKKTQQSHY